MKYPDEAAIKYVLDYLDGIGVGVTEIAKLVSDNQSKYSEQPIEFYEKNVRRVLRKREFLNNIMVMIFLDEADEKQLLPAPLNDIIGNDMFLFGVDEGLALQASQVFGNIAITNYSYLDKTKPGIIGKLDSSGGNTTFADDIISAIVASTAAHSAHEVA